MQLFLKTPLSMQIQFQCVYVCLGKGRINKNDKQTNAFQDIIEIYACIFVQFGMITKDNSELTEKI